MSECAPTRRLIAARQRICEEGGEGLFFPAAATEWQWDARSRTFLYLAGMIYCFLGVSLIADIFMGAIETITNTRKKVRRSSGHWSAPKVWNDTVANLSLMALGSSAPEIFLSVIDLFRNRMHSGALGLATIVGSAAFNLFVIVAVCIAVIPDGDTRHIDALPVFYVTAMFSLGAYMWLVVMLVVWTPNVVEIWEAVVTFGMFPALIWVSYKTDKGECEILCRLHRSACDGKADAVSRCVSPMETDGREENDCMDTVVTTHVPSVGSCPPALEPRLSVHSKLSRCSTSAVRETNSSVVRNEARHRFLCNMTKSRQSMRYTQEWRSPRTSLTTLAVLRRSSTTSSNSSMVSRGSLASQHRGASTHLQFRVDFQCMSAGVAAKPITVVRVGDLMFDVRVSYSVRLCAEPLRRSSEALCLPGIPQSTVEAPVPVTDEVSRGELAFMVGEREKDLTIEGLEGPTSDFVVQLTDMTILSEPFQSSSVSLGPLASTRVHVTPMDSTGTIGFASTAASIQGCATMQNLEILVVRSQGCADTVVCKFRTEPLTAVPGCHYVHMDGALVFNEGKTEQVITLGIWPKAVERASCELCVFLDEVEGADIDEEMATLIVTIDAVKTDLTESWTRRVDNFVSIDNFGLARAEWVDQVVGVICINGCWEEHRHAKLSDWSFHLACLPWKLVFALAPPTRLLGGWPCFFVALVFIALLTGMIADLAELFGCVLDLEDIVTALTFVALGTSMPDLFASQTAAIEQPTADASIVNVMGSNSVNVFLGVGLPWTIGSIYWALIGRSAAWEARYPEVASKYPAGHAVFVVESGSLGFSVCVFVGCCILAFTLLLLRRRCVGAELGGPPAIKYATACVFILLWIGHVGLSSWRALRYGRTTVSEYVAVVASVGATWCLGTLVPVTMMYYRKETPTEKDRDG